MIDRSLIRALVTSAVLAAGGALLAGCNADEASLAANAKANQPVPPKLISAINEKDMDLQSPILVRLFKQEAELEVWKQDRSGKFALLKTYPICRWSGDLGPKVREGDRQAPEGFYAITPAQMNPQSAYYLSFNTGYPNAFDKALGRSGSQLMVHGDCSSRGCYAMTDEQIAEIYSLGRESFFGGQRSFQFQAYPFRMTPVNMAKHRNNPNMAFWKMIKEGYDHFEVTRQEPKVDFCEKKYVFDAVRPPGATADPVFNASAKCPAYVVPDEIAEAVKKKENADQAEIGEADRQGYAGREAQHRHRRRHEPDLRRPGARRQHRPVGRWRRSGPVAFRLFACARHHPWDRQSAPRARRHRRCGFRACAGSSGCGSGCCSPGSTRGLDACCICRAERRVLAASSPTSPARSEWVVRRTRRRARRHAAPAKPKTADAKPTRQPRPRQQRPSKALAAKPAETKQAVVTARRSSPPRRLKRNRLTRQRRRNRRRACWPARNRSCNPTPSTTASPR